MPATIPQHQQLAIVALPPECWFQSICAGCGYWRAGASAALTDACRVNGYCSRADGLVYGAGNLLAAGTGLYDVNRRPSADGPGARRVLLDWIYHRDKSGAKAASAIAIMFWWLNGGRWSQACRWGTFIGQHFWLADLPCGITLLGVIALMSSQLLILPIFPVGRPPGIRDGEVLTHPRLLLIYAVTALGWQGYSRHSPSGAA